MAGINLISAILASKSMAGINLISAILASEAYHQL